MMREDEGGDVVGRLVAPPTFPLVIGPWPADRPEHVAPEDPRADVLESRFCDLVVHARVAAGLPVHFTPDARVEEPLHQLRAADAKRMVEALVRAGAVPVDRHPEASDDESRHGHMTRFRL